MSDHTDDWMNPKPISWERPARTYPRFVIERERRIQGPLTEWREWDHYATRDERDAALHKLQEEHPAWHLRPSDEYWEPQWIATL